MIFQNEFSLFNRRYLDILFSDSTTQREKEKEKEKEKSKEKPEEKKPKISPGAGSPFGQLEKTSPLQNVTPIRKSDPLPEISTKFHVQVHVLP